MKCSYCNSENEIVIGIICAECKDVILDQVKENKELIKKRRKEIKKEFEQKLKLDMNIENLKDEIDELRHFLRARKKPSEEETQEKLLLTSKVVELRSSGLTYKKIAKELKLTEGQVNWLYSKRKRNVDD